MNEYLDQVRQQVYQHQRELVEKKEPVTALSLEAGVIRKPEEEVRMVLQVYQEHNDNMKQMINRGIAHGTWERHVTSRKHLEHFIKDTYRKPDFNLKDIDHAFIVKYDFYLRITRQCQTNSAVKYIKTLVRFRSKTVRNKVRAILYLINNNLLSYGQPSDPGGFFCSSKPKCSGVVNESE